MNAEDALAAVEPSSDEGEVEDAEEPCHEARAPKTLFNPLLPTAREVAEHNITHCPYRSWCDICVRTRGREDAHRRQEQSPEESGLPEVGMDYDYFGDKEDS